MVQEKRLTERLTDMEKLIEELYKKDKLKGEKRFRFPRGIKRGGKKGKVLFVLIRNNNIWDMRLLPVKDETVYLKDNGTFHIAHAKYIGMFKGKYPIIFQPEWSVEPITKSVLLNASRKRKTSVVVQRHIIKLMEGTGDLAMKPKRSMKGILLVGALLIGAYLIASQMGII